MPARSTRRLRLAKSPCGSITNCDGLSGVCDPAGGSPEFERAMIRERAKAGLERARAQGKTLGRRTIDATTEATIRKALKKGDTGIRKIATMLGVGTGTVQWIKAEMSA
jgi:hypothetical protein